MAPELYDGRRDTLLLKRFAASLPGVVRANHPRQQAAVTSPEIAGEREHYGLPPARPGSVSDALELLQARLERAKQEGRDPYHLIDLEQLRTRLSSVVNDTALMFAHEPDEVFIKALKRMRIELRSEFGDMIRKVPEATSLIEEVLTCTVIQRRDIELGAGLAPTVRTLH